MLHDVSILSKRPQKLSNTLGNPRRVDAMEHKPDAGEQFVCAACGAEFDRETAVAECRMCHRSYCDQCLNEKGFCVPCGDKA